MPGTRARARVASETPSAWLQGDCDRSSSFTPSLDSSAYEEFQKGGLVRLRTHRNRTTRFAAAGTAVAAFLATLAGLLGASIGTSIAPAGAETNGLTTYETDCVGTGLAAGQ